MKNLGDNVHGKLKEEKEIRNEFVEVIRMSGQMKTLIVHTLFHDLALRSVYFIQEETERKTKRAKISVDKQTSTLKYFTLMIKRVGT